jgi:molecular chaperone DnaJ
LGNLVEVITLEGIEKITLPAGSQPDDYLILPSRGCYLGINSTKRGNFRICLKVKLPKKITESTEKILRELVANAKKKDGRI